MNVKPNLSQEWQLSCAVLEAKFFKFCVHREIMKKRQKERRIRGGELRVGGGHREKKRKIRGHLRIGARHRGRKKERLTRGGEFRVGARHLGTRLGGDEVATSDSEHAPNDLSFFLSFFLSFAVASYDSELVNSRNLELATSISLSFSVATSVSEVANSRRSELGSREPQRQNSWYQFKQLKLCYRALS